MSFIGEVQDANWGRGRSARQIVINGSVLQLDRSFDLPSQANDERPINVVDLQDNGVGAEVTLIVKVSAGGLDY